MSIYRVKFYKGDYSHRQAQANEDQATVYVEQHFNSLTPDANYACVIIGRNASARSKALGMAYSTAIAKTFGIPSKGVIPGGFNGRGAANIEATKMPAVLLEPFFVSNPNGALWARTRQDDLARILADSIRKIFPDGGLIAFSVGHKYKTSSPNDRGATVLGGGNEADLAEQVLIKTRSLL